MSARIVLTPEEKRAIASLRRLARRWPKTLWIFAGDGEKVSILKCNENGERAQRPGGTVDQAYIVGDAKIPNDGGDW